MKREARNHSKMKRLCRRLDIPLYQAMGIMESLWHVTAIEAWRGDIGKLSNEDIALSLDYRGDENALIDALVSCGWLDESKEHRLLVHDWKEHADNAVQKKARRAIESGQSGFYPEMSGHVQTNADNGGHFQTNGQNGSLPEPVPVPEPEPGAAATSADEPPPGLPMLTYARGLLENCFIPVEPSMTQLVSSTIGGYAREHKIEAYEATKQLTELARDALARDETVNRFWFTDRKWKRKEKGNESHNARIAREAIESLDRESAH